MRPTADIANLNFDRCSQFLEDALANERSEVVNVLLVCCSMQLIVCAYEFRFCDTQT